MLPEPLRLPDALLAAAGSVPLAVIATALALGGAVRLVPALRRPSPLLALSLAGMAFVERSGAAGFLLGGAVIYAAGAFVSRAGGTDRAGRLQRWRAALAAIAVLASLFLWRRPDFEGQLQVRLGGLELAVLVLHMWLVLRSVTFFYELGAGRIALPRPEHFALWYLLPFTLAGPILRYSEFEPFLRSLAPRAGPAPPSTGAWLRPAARGLAEVALAVACGWAKAELLARATGGWLTAAKGLDIFFFAPWGFLWLLGGTYRVMQAAASLWALALPPSFEAPFGRPNLSEFWANFNMTAMRVFRDYVFMARWGLRRPNLYFNAVLVFLFCGAWHAFNGYWLLWGTLHGAAFALYLLHRQAPERWRLPLFSSRLASAAATYVFVCLCWYIPSKLLAFLHS